MIQTEKCCHLAFSHLTMNRFTVDATTVARQKLQQTACANHINLHIS